MKEIRQTVFELSPGQTHGRTDARTDGRTHGRTDGRRVILYPPELEFGGIMSYENHHLAKKVIPQN